MAIDPPPNRASVTGVIAEVVRTVLRRDDTASVPRIRDSGNWNSDKVKPGGAERSRRRGACGQRCRSYAPVAAERVPANAPCHRVFPWVAAGRDKKYSKAGACLAVAETRESQVRRRSSRFE